MNRLKSSEIAAYREKRRADQCNLDPITRLFIENPCLDHDHVSGRVRQVLDRDTNAFEGKVFNAWRRYLRHKGVPLERALSGLLEYYSVDYSGNPLHPTFRTEEEKRIRRNKRAKRRRKQKQTKEKQ